MTDRLIIPGRFRAHAAGPSQAKAATASPSSPTKQLPSNGQSRAYRRPPGPSTSSSPLTPAPARQRRRRPSTRRVDEFARGDGTSSNQTPANERTWLLRPSRDRVETWLDAWWKRWLVLVVLPSVIVSFAVPKLCTHWSKSRFYVMLIAIQFNRSGEILGVSF
jgi:hypothetical protein